MVAPVQRVRGQVEEHFTGEGAISRERRELEDVGVADQPIGSVWAGNHCVFTSVGFAPSVRIEGEST
jgi:hypothetical protein